MSDVKALIVQGHTAFQAWSSLSLLDRKDHISRFKLELAQKKSDLAQAISREMGKPLSQAATEVEKCLQLIDYCLLSADAALIHEKTKNYTVQKMPLGLIYGIMPWNFPVWQTLRFAIPTLLAGNTILLKPADNVAGVAILLHEVFQKSISISGVFTNVFMSHSTSDEVIAHDLVQGVSFTGSTRAGKWVAKVAGENLKKCVLELGGNDAYILCSDADFALAAQKIYQGRMLNSGQSCISAKRIFVPIDQEQDFLNLLKKYVQEIQFGDPLLQKNLLGPLARRDLVDHLQDQLGVALAQGAEIFYQKEVPQELKSGCFFAPTILHKIPHNSIAHFDEFFGPVFSVIGYKDIEAAIELANQSPYGLGGAIFSKNIEQAYNLAQRLETGSVAINDYLKSAPEKPFGGIKKSGYGSELGKDGFLEFTYNKVITL